MAKTCVQLIGMQKTTSDNILHSFKKTNLLTSPTTVKAVPTGSTLSTRLTPSIYELIQIENLRIFV